MTEQTFPIETLRDLLDGEGSAADKIQAIYNEIQILDPPLPDPLFGARATHLDHGEGIVTSHHPDEDGEVRFMSPEEASGDGTLGHWVSPSTLTFHTQETPDHPEYLETEEDYRSAPEGTIVADGEYWPCILSNSVWMTVFQNYIHHFNMAGLRRRVLRWGWES